MIVEIVGSDGKTKMARGLFDSGCTKSIVLKKFTKGKLGRLRKNQRTSYSVGGGGTFVSDSSTELELKFVEFSNSKRIEYQFQVDSTTSSKDSPHDIIIGNDLMHKLGVDICYSTEHV